MRVYNVDRHAWFGDAFVISNDLVPLWSIDLVASDIAVQLVNASKGLPPALISASSFFNQPTWSEAAHKTYKKETGNESVS